jgi:hypothetical protein
MPIKGVHGPINMHEVPVHAKSSKARPDAGTTVFQISRTSQASGLDNGHSNEDNNVRLGDVKIQVGPRAKRVRRVLRVELFVQNQTSGQPSGTVTVEDTGASVTINSTHDFKDTGDHMNYNSKVLGHISRIVVTQTDGKIQTVAFNPRKGQLLSLMFKLEDIPASAGRAAAAL